MEKVITDVNLPLPIFVRGKVRNVYELQDKLIIVATDRISAFDVVLPEGIPDKGKVLTKISIFWFEYTKDIVENHLISSEVPKEIEKYREILDGRIMLVKKTERIPIECVVRGYLSGSAWEEYKIKKETCGIKLKEGLLESDKLEQIIFTPATKAESGHDINITEEEAKETVGEKIFREIKEKSIKIFQKASSYAEEKGIIIADTKFEFGIIDDKIILIDEILTSDSSRFWDKKIYKKGVSQPSFDKQFVRDYLNSICWDRNPPAPHLPEEIINKTREKYLEAYKRIVGKEL